MKKSILLIGGVILLGSVLWYYFNKGKQNPNLLKDAEYAKARVIYTGPERWYTGLSIKSGDVLTGELDNKNNFRYVMWGNGFIASSTTFLIPSSQIKDIIIL
jgi:hypothetical protein